MNINRIKLYNYVTFENAEVELGPEPYLVIGVNEDEQSATSNGSGKSLLCQSVLWCLFDSISRKGVKKDGVIGPADDHCYVEIDFFHGGKSYTAVRYRNHPEYGNKMHLFEDGEDISLHKGSQIEEILGISSAYIHHCAYTDEKSEPIVALTPAKLKDVATEVLNLKRFDDYIKLIKAEVKTEDRRLSIREGKISEASVMNQRLRQELEGARADLASFEDRRRSAIASIERQVTEAEEELQADLKTIEKLGGYRNKMQELSGTAEKIDELNSDRKRLQKKVTELKAAGSRLQIRQEELDGKRESLKQQLANIVNNPTGICSYCGSDMKNEEHLNTILNKLNSELDQVQIDYADVTVSKRANSNKLSTLEPKLKEVSKRIDETTPFIDQMAKLQKSLEVLSAAEASSVRLRTAISKGENLKAEYMSRTDEATRRRIDRLVAEVEEHDQHMLGLRQDAEEAEENILLCKELIDALQASKANAANTFLQVIASTTQSNLQELTDGDYQVELQSKNGLYEFLFSQASKQGNWLPYHVFSRGEKARISKCVAVALEGLLDVGFMVDDEGIGGVDPAGARDIVEFLVKAAEGKTLLMVSHDHSISDLFDEGNTILVRKRGGISTVEKV